MPNKKTAELIKAGLVGCGRISSQHLSAINLLKNQIKLMAVCDTDRNKAEEAASKYGVPFYTDYRDLLKRRDIDLVIICTPNGLHYPMAKSAAFRGKHVLLEKPLALNLKDGDALIKAFKKRNKKLMVVMQVRYNPALIALKKAIEEGKLGKIYSAALTIRWSRPQSYFSQASWRGKKSLDGGALLNQAIHYIDVLSWVLGKPQLVFAKTDRVAHKIEAEDEAFALMKFKKGAYGLVEFTICAYPRNLECSITVLGEKGTVKIGGKAVNEIELWEVKNYPKPKISNKVFKKFSGSSPHHLSLYKDIAGYFNGGKKPFFLGEEARKSLEIIEAIYDSADKNREIKL